MEATYSKYPGLGKKISKVCVKDGVALRESSRRMAAASLGMVRIP